MTAPDERVAGAMEDGAALAGAEQRTRTPMLRRLFAECGAGILAAPGAALRYRRLERASRLGRFLADRFAACSDCQGAAKHS